MTTVLGVTLDCVDIERVAQFWAHALGIEVVDRLSPRVRALEVPVGDQRLLLTFRQVTAAKVTANRVRLDLQTAELENETARLLSLGAIRIASDRVAHRWAILADVEGNEFDLIDERGTGEPAGDDIDHALSERRTGEPCAAHTSSFLRAAATPSTTSTRARRSPDGCWT